MVILFWLFCLILFIACGYLLLRSLLLYPPSQTAIKTFAQGFKEGLKGAGFLFPRKSYAIELFKWETMEDDDVCEDCLERASWPAMDIADWMKEGLPRTPEADTRCGGQCRCELIPYKSKTKTKKF